MKELFYTSPYKIRLHTIRIEYGEIGEKFVLKVFEGEINFKGDFEEKPIDAIFEEEEEMLMHLSSINSVLINGGWKLREKTDVLIKSFRALRFLSKNKYKIIIPLFFLPIFLVGIPRNIAPTTVPHRAIAITTEPWKISVEFHKSWSFWSAPDITTVSNPKRKPARAAVNDHLVSLFIL